ncbi:MAG: DUF1127 domain-containing protein [Rhodobacteraceae bacterium]|jgi:uncharacterized protein YjiS (DUF1127 family)|nr:DUF1127 domain-containing protein [Paracoccaceae bacterium]
MLDDLRTRLRQRRELRRLVKATAHLDDHLLRDIGLAPECRVPVPGLYMLTGSG